MEGIEEFVNSETPFIFNQVTDLERSGAGIAWDYFMNQPRLPMISIVEDRDLWRFKYKETRAIAAYMFSFEYTWANWDSLEEEIANNQHIIVPAGEAIERKHFKDINELLPICTRELVIDNHGIECANLPYTLVSDAGNILAKRNPLLFGACYYDGEFGRNFSLRSIEGGLDVSEIAKKFGGGGHARAAGFRVSFETAKEFELK
jgi:oligoribonuclease NrnB/cAMP/cGMP phosphodiesterase (DHH superfamily)